jgi:hypothetical protein
MVPRKFEHTPNHNHNKLMFTRELLTTLIGTTKVKGDAADATNTPAYIATVMQALSAVYEHVHGTAKTDDFGNLEWLTLSVLKQPSKTTAKRPLFAEAVNADAAEGNRVPLADGTVRRYLENCRSVLYAANKHLTSTKFDAAYDELGVVCDELNEKLQVARLERRRSEREERNWVDWNALQSTAKQTVLPYIQGALAGENDDLNEHSIKELHRLQAYLLFSMYTLLPPVRNNYATLRFVAEVDATWLRVQLAQAPNYILVPNSGPPVLVLNEFKNDQRSLSEDYDVQENGDFQLDHARTRRIPLDKDPKLEACGFDPKTLGDLLLGYRRMHLFRNRNPDELLFYSVAKRGRGQPAPNVTRLSKEAMKSRLARVSELLTKGEQASGACIGSKMMRTIFLSWFDAQDPDIDTRKHVAHCMCHDVKTQLGNYTKNRPGSKRRRSGGKGSKAKRARAVVDDATVIDAIRTMITAPDADLGRLTTKGIRTALVAKFGARMHGRKKWIKEQADLLLRELDSGEGDASAERV